MPKFVISISHQGRPGRITVSAADAQSARTQAEMDGHTVRDVALAMPESEPKVAVKRVQVQDAKVDIGTQVLCHALGPIGLICLILAGWGQFWFLPGAAALAFVYFKVCKPRNLATIWSTYWGFGTLGLLAVAGVVGLEIYALCTAPKLKLPEAPLDQVWMGLSVIGQLLSLVGLGFVACSRMKESA